MNCGEISMEMLALVSSLCLLKFVYNILVKKYQGLIAATRILINKNDNFKYQAILIKIQLQDQSIQFVIELVAT